MTHQAMIILFISAASIGFIHTLLGPDHYLPFIVLSKARRWLMFKTLMITLCCGVGHVLSAVFLGFIALSIGLTITKLQWVENMRGTIAVWILIGFGGAYCLWGIRQIIKQKRHAHWHFHRDGGAHNHIHGHLAEHAHPHAGPRGHALVPWILFIIFILGPCEPLIPLITYPALQGQIGTVFFTVLFFGLATILVMLSVVWMTVYGSQRLQFPFFEKYGHAMAGAIICGSGLAIKCFGL